MHLAKLRRRFVSSFDCTTKRNLLSVDMGLGFKENLLRGQKVFALNSITTMWLSDSFRNFPHRERS